MIRSSILLVLALGFCQGDETLTGYGAADVTWSLESLNGTEFPATATLTFPNEGEISGKAPCNGFGGEQSAPYPWFKAENIISTQLACADIEAENTFFSALNSMSISEVAGDTLILSNEDGQEMVFRAN
ncbi:META domain-containing protein [Falsihalocynthiibacter sp. SS001]|uniref:META domain-containing protein n=1 Tax=Falsihalocynthiibacter sp. SS001 TaxID=3349698 RepID=UPI0036D2AC2D